MDDNNRDHKISIVHSHPSTSTFLDRTCCIHKYDVFLSHDWDMDEKGRDYHERVSRWNNNALKQSGIKTWFDGDQMNNIIVGQMLAGKESSLFVTTIITKEIIEKGDRRRKKGVDDNCEK